MNRLLLLALILLAGVGCGSSDQTTGYGGEADLAFARTAEKHDSEFLAYEHALAVDTSEDKLADSLKSLTNACADDRENQCTVLHSEINLGGYKVSGA